MAGVTVGGDWWSTTVRAGGFYHLQLNKDVNKGRERVKRMQRECSLILVLSAAGIKFIIGNISSRVSQAAFLPPI